MEEAVAFDPAEWLSRAMDNGYTVTVETNRGGDLSVHFDFTGETPEPVKKALCEQLNAVPNGYEMLRRHLQAVSRLHMP